MRAKTTAALLGAAALGSAFLLPGGATAAQQDSTTGGGQILVSSDGGAGDTVAFTAQGTPEAARGQVQYVDRSNGNGQGQTVVHGTVDCVVVTGNIARISGVWRDGNDTPFALYVEDNGEGDGTDIVAFAPVDDAQCADDVPEDEQTALGRGNAQVREAGTGRSS